MKLIVVMGPTGSGKTGFGIRLAKDVSGEIINADSVQLYRGFDIGSAKPTPEELNAAPHHLIGVIEPQQDFDAASFARLAGEKAAEIAERGNTPVVVGGTFLYVKALTRGLFPGPPGDQDIREGLRREAEEKGSEALWERLREVDPASSERIHPNDLVRITRALEVYELTGKPMSSHTESHGFRGKKFSTLGFWLTMDRDELYERIDKRVDEMMERGFLKEVEALLGSGVSPESKPMSSLGYRHLAAHIRGELALDDAVRLIKRDTRRYAKRQVTWLKKEPGLIRVAPGEYEKALAEAKAFLRKH